MIARHTGGTLGGAAIGVLGGLIGLGGAEFRLPLLIGAFRFGAVEAVILNKAMSLVVVVTALIFRTKAVPLELLTNSWLTVVNLLAGSLIGAWLGAAWATQLKSETLFKTIAALLVVIAGFLLFGHGAEGTAAPALAGIPLIVAGVVAGFLIGIVASIMGVAGGELLIPTLIILFGTDIKLAGSLSLAVSLPTMLVGFVRYSRDQSFTVIRRNWSFAVCMAVGSIVGGMVGAQLLGLVPGSILLPGLSAILLISAYKVWGHK
jgi:uncharacterized membrane protein YfcA